MLTGISAITLATHDMARAVMFYQALGFVLKFGGPTASFTSFHAGSGYLNLTLIRERTWRGEVGAARSSMWTTSTRNLRRPCPLAWRPNSAHGMRSWGERYFHIIDPDGHELSFARPI